MYVDLEEAVIHGKLQLVTANPLAMVLIITSPARHGGYREAYNFMTLLGKSWKYLLRALRIPCKRMASGKGKQSCA